MRHLLLIRSLVILLCLGCAGPVAGVDDQSCDYWIQLSNEARFLVIGNALEGAVGAPNSSLEASCLWGISEQIADHSVEICRLDGGRHLPATTRALETAVEYCETR